MTVQVKRIFIALHVIVMSNDVCEMQTFKTAAKMIFDAIRFTIYGNYLLKHILCFS